MIENDLRATLRNFGLKVGMVRTVKLSSRARSPPREFITLLGGEGSSVAARGACSR